MYSLPEVKVLQKVIKDAHLHSLCIEMGLKKAFSCPLSCITPVCRALSLYPLPHDIISTPHFMSSLAHEVAVMCPCSSLSHRNTHSSRPVLQPLDPPPPIT
ncbi:hypothetical protein AMECASPLE_029729 [Ameca splendens]|uniref:Uncharacterized protein n=1 Tax=Ameca splendens TaxID=208324 RepID=A0ABV1AD76_9TELE